MRVVEVCGLIPCLPKQGVRIYCQLLRLVFTLLTAFLGGALLKNEVLAVKKNSSVSSSKLL